MGIGARGVLSLFFDFFGDNESCFCACVSETREDNEIWKQLKKLAKRDIYSWGDEKNEWRVYLSVCERKYLWIYEEDWEGVEIAIYSNEEDRILLLDCFLALTLAETAKNVFVIWLRLKNKTF